MWKINATIVCLVLVASLGSLRIGANPVGVEIPTGSTWTYTYNETLYEPGQTDLSIDGTWTYTCLGLADMVIGDNDSKSVGFYSSLKANVSGTVVEHNFFGNPSSTPAVGTLKSFERVYYDLVSGLPIASITDRVLEVREGRQATVRTLIYYDEHNQTNYTSVRTTPADLVIHSDYSDLAPGTSWAVEYSGFTNSTGVEGTKYYSHSSKFNETINYTYVGQENVIVVAGKFNCSKIRHAYQDANVTEWYCPELGGYAKIVSSTTGDEIVNSLISYHLENEVVPIGANELHDPAIVVLSYGAVASVVVATVVLHLWKQKQPPASQTMPQLNGKKVG